ncbi:Aminopeptidase N [bacterium HR35]|nr:Aminopeptidase N [bacterium HR35]
MEVKKYYLDYDFDLNKKIFKGKVKIDLNLEKKIKILELDSEDLTINQVKLNDKKVKFSLTKDKLKIFGSFQQKNTIEIEFEGKLIEGLSGIYLSRYKEGSKEKFLITTQFEPIEARKAFPCIDHPAYKAVFELSLAFDKNLIAISNTLPQKEEIIGNKKRVIFKETPRMSTYLLYIGIGEFEFLQDKYRDVLIRVATTKGKSKGGKFALEVAKKCLEYFEKVFGEKYPLEKLDMIALPDFSDGAMENWGAITFREELLLVFKGITPELRKKIIAEVIAHEISHMWFGNLVTMKWWDDLWLNESFATYLAYRAIDKYYPQFEKMKDFIINEVLGAVSRDVYKSTHPIKVKVRDPKEIEDIFDAISYNKGGSILRSLNLFLGDKLFFGGLRDYIKKFKYQNAEASDLWDSLQKFSKIQVKKIMNDYITKPGTPIVYLTQKNNKIEFRQARFTLEKDLPQIWYLPLFLKIGKKENNLILKNKKLDLSIKNPNEVITLNSNFSGYYLTFYPLEKVNEVIQKANENEILNILTSYRLLTIRGDLSLEDYYQIFRDLKNKNFEKYSRAIFLYLNFLREDFLNFNKPEIAEELKILSQKIITTFGIKIKKNEPLKIKELKIPALLNLAYHFEEPKIVKLFLNEFEKNKKNLENLNPELKVIIFSLAVNFDWQTLLDYYEKTNLIEEKRKVLIALARVKDNKLFNQFLDFVLSKNVRFNQTFNFFIGVNQNKGKEEIVFEWLRRNYKKLKEKGGKRKELSVIRNILTSAFSYFGPKVKEEKLNKFVSENNLKEDFPQTIPFLLEKIKIERKFIDRNK